VPAKVYVNHVHVGAHGSLTIIRIPQKPELQAVGNHLMWVLLPSPGLCKKSVYVLNCQAISPSPTFKTLCVCVCVFTPLQKQGNKVGRELHPACHSTHIASEGTPQLEARWRLRTMGLHEATGHSEPHSITRRASQSGEIVYVR